MSSTYRRVLAVVDLSDDAVEVVRRAAAIAAAGELIVAHFCETAQSIDLDYGMVGLPGIGIDTGGLTESAGEQLAKILESAGGMQARPIVRRGTARQDIPALAEELGADLIVVGAVRRQGLERLLLGSTARTVLNSCDCDVLAVRLRPGEAE